MTDRKWFDPRQPQTLQIATMLLYFYAVLGVITALLGGGLVTLVAIAGGVGAFGMANEKKWGYQLATASAVLRLLLPLLWISPTDWLRYSPITLMIAVAIVALLLHPQSRDYQRIWYS